VTALEKERLEGLLHRFKRQGLFSKRPGCVNGTTHTINTGNNTPYRSNPRPMSREKRDILDYHIDALLEEDVIEPCESEWLSCPVLTKKKTGGNNPENFRLCIGYRFLNNRTKVMPHTMTRIDFILSQLGKAKVFTMFDLSKGYHQIPTDPDS
jgi:hypothetical protein